MSTANITQERAARRFHQVAVLERRLQVVLGEIAQVKQHMRELKDREEGLLDRLRVAARDEGELPLFDMDEGDEA